MPEKCAASTMTTTCKKNANKTHRSTRTASSESGAADGDICRGSNHSMKNYVAARRQCAVRDRLMLPLLIFVALAQAAPAFETRIDNSTTKPIVSGMTCECD